MNIIKYITTLASGLLLVFSNLSAQNAQTTVATDPVGYVNITIKGTGGVGNQAFNFISIPLIPAASEVGKVSSLDSFSLFDTSKSWNVDEWKEAYFVEITSGDALGFSSQIIGNTADQLYIAEDLSSALSIGDTFVIRPYPTLASVFGETESDVESLGVRTGISVLTADEILFPNTNGGYDTYFFNSNDISILNGWRSTNAATTDASGTIIAPGSGIIYKRKAIADFDLVVANSVQVLTSINGVIETSFNFLASNYPIPTTLVSFFGEDGVAAGLNGGLSVVNADNILVPNDLGGYDTYYYNTNSLALLSGWRSTKSATVDAKDAVIAEPGKSFIVRRAGAPTNITETRPF